MGPKTGRGASRARARRAATSVPLRGRQAVRARQARSPAKGPRARRRAAEQATARRARSQQAKRQAAEDESVPEDESVEEDEAEDEADDDAESDAVHGQALDKHLYSKVTTKQFKQMFEDLPSNSLRHQFKGLKVRCAAAACCGTHAFLAEN